MAKTQRDEFADGFAAMAPSTALPALFRVGFPDLPDWARTFGFVPSSAMRDLGRLLGLQRGSLLLDVACGMGGPGQIVADEFGASVIGVDFAVPAVQTASEVARAHGKMQAAYVAGSGEAVPIRDGAADAVMCIDALRFIPGFGFPALNRVLRPGGRIGLTVWERPAEGGIPGLQDVAGLLTSAGFEVEHVSRHDEWLDAQDAVYAAAHAARAAGETDPGALAIAEEGDRIMGKLERGCRVMAVAVKP